MVSGFYAVLREGLSPITQLLQNGFLATLLHTDQLQKSLIPPC